MTFSPIIPRCDVGRRGSENARGMDGAGGSLTVQYSSPAPLEAIDRHGQKNCAPSAHEGSPPYRSAIILALYLYVSKSVIVMSVLTPARYRSQTMPCFSI